LPSPAVAKVRDAGVTDTLDGAAPCTTLTDAVLAVSFPSVIVTALVTALRVSLAANVTTAVTVYLAVAPGSPAGV